MSQERAVPVRTVPRPCPICERPADPSFRPFCSARCADVDLGRWLTDHYAIPASEHDVETDDLPSDDRTA